MIGLPRRCPLATSRSPTTVEDDDEWQSLGRGLHRTHMIVSVGSAGTELVHGQFIGAECSRPGAVLCSDIVSRLFISR
jgi:hypothetical protein